MILQALYNYYWNLSSYQQGLDEDEGGRKIAPPGMEWKTIPYIIVIKRDGSFVRIEYTNDQRFLIPKDNARSVNIEGQVLWDHCGYLLGIPRSDTDSDAKRCPEQFANFREKIMSLPDTEALNAVKLFYEKEEYLRARADKLINDIKNTKGGRITFVIEGNPRIAVASLPEVIGHMNPERRDNEQKNIRMRCLVTGKADRPVALTHEKIAIGTDNAPFIGIQKASGFDSYGKEQGLNAPISYEASDAIGTALKELLRKGGETSMRVGNTVYIFWSSLLDPEFIQNYQQLAFYPQDKKEDDEDMVDGDEGDDEANDYDPERKVEKLLAAMKMYVGGVSTIDDTDYSRERFFMLGLMPNSGRIAVKFWAEGTVQEMAKNILAHMEDFHIVNWDTSLDKTPHPQSIYQIICALKPKGKKLNKMSTNLLEEIIESIVKGRPYPTLVQKLCLRKNRRERNVTQLRAAILKAFINRKNRYQKKDIIMQPELDKTQTDVGYLAGRLLALYEYTQEKALGDVNTSIKDRFFSKASVVPKAVFPKMERLHQKHIKKLSTQNRGYKDRIVKEHRDIRALFPGSAPVFPARLSLDQQNMFDNGYYHESKALYTSSKKKEADASESDSSENE